ncbi:hypothetical protein, partial [Halalkalicoccus jeotgali]
MTATVEQLQTEYDSIWEAVAEERRAREKLETENEELRAELEKQDEQIEQNAEHIEQVDAKAENNNDGWSLDHRPTSETEHLDALWLTHTEEEIPDQPLGRIVNGARSKADSNATEIRDIALDRIDPDDYLERTGGMDPNEMIDLHRHHQVQKGDSIADGPFSNEANTARAALLFPRLREMSRGLQGGAREICAKDLADEIRRSFANDPERKAELADPAENANTAQRILRRC